MGIQRLWQKPPVAFPAIGLIHVSALIYLVYDYITDPVLIAQPISMLLYTVAWLFACDLRKWAVFVYMGLTTLNLWARFMIDDAMIRNNYTDVIFPADVIFTFILLLYYKKFD